MQSFKTLALTAALTVSMSGLTLLSGCGGGGDSGGSVGLPPPGPVVLTITDTVVMTTNKGVIEIGLDATHAPITVANFKKYVNDGFYSGTLFHRVISNFVIQGGGFTRVGSTLTEKTPTYAPITLESNNGLSNVRGTVAMARTTVANSATSQFFISTVDNSTCLDRGTTSCDPTGNGYAVFGKVTVGLDVVDAIKAVPTATTSGFADVPVTDVVVTSIKLK